MSKSPFFSFISLRGSGPAVYICLVGGIVIFDEILAFTGIDIRVNSVHCPGFGDSEVNLAALLIYSKHMFLIFTIKLVERLMRLGYFVSVRGNSCLISSAKELFLFLAE